jgi:hypothetical protein
MEASFFVTAEALRRLQPCSGTDARSLLKAFDINRDLICATAAKIYARGSRGSYELVVSDFARAEGSHTKGPLWL